jgi:hypothetical protein
MPVQRVADADLESVVDDLEKKNRIIAVTRSGDGAYVVTYEPRAKRATPGDKETR